MLIRGQKFDLYLNNNKGGAIKTMEFDIVLYMCEITVLNNDLVIFNFKISVLFGLFILFLVTE